MCDTNATIITPTERKFKWICTQFSPLKRHYGNGTSTSCGFLISMRTAGGTKIRWNARHVLILWKSTNLQCHNFHLTFAYKTRGQSQIRIPDSLRWKFQWYGVRCEIKLNSSDSFVWNCIHFWRFSFSANNILNRLMYDDIFLTAHRASEKISFILSLGSVDFVGFGIFCSDTNTPLNSANKQNEWNRNWTKMHRKCNALWRSPLKKSIISNEMMVVCQNEWESIR